MREDGWVALRRQRGEADTRSQILDIAERLVQSRGFNGFSYADVASELSVTKASLHYHFPGKAELGEALIRRYAARFADALEEIDRRGEGAPAKLEAYAGIYADVLKDRRMCLCGMLAADYETLPAGMRDEVIGFFDANEAWLAGVLEEGQRDGILRHTGSAADAAQAIVSGLEGALLIARPYGDVARFQAAASRLLASLATAAPDAAAASSG
jgi:TetR/AcrR family transcriptional repressor of nem operon